MAIITSLYFLCGVIYIVVGLFTFLNDKRNIINRIFFILCIDVAFWAFMFTLLNRSADAKAVIDYYVYSSFFWAPVGCMLLHFVILLTGKERFLNRRYKYIILYFPALFSIYLYLFQPPKTEDVAKVNGF